MAAACYGRNRQRSETPIRARMTSTVDHRATTFDSSVLMHRYLEQVYDRRAPARIREIAAVKRALSKSTWPSKVLSLSRTGFSKVAPTKSTHDSNSTASI